MGLMTTRSSRSVPAAVVCGTTVGLAALVRAGHDGSDVGVVDCDSGAFEVLGQPPDKPGWAVGRRGAIDGDCVGS